MDGCAFSRRWMVAHRSTSRPKKAMHPPRSSSLKLDATSIFRQRMGGPRLGVTYFVHSSSSDLYTLFIQFIPRESTNTEMCTSVELPKLNCHPGWKTVCARATKVCAHVREEAHIDDHFKMSQLEIFSRRPASCLEMITHPARQGILFIPDASILLS
jgi:hypothetical protein